MRGRFETSLELFTASRRHAASVSRPSQWCHRLMALGFGGFRMIALLQKDTVDLAKTLREKHRINADHYHAGLTPTERHDVQMRCLPGIGRAMIKPRFAARTDASPCRPCCSNAHGACLRCAGHCGTALATCSAGQTINARLYAPLLVRTNKAVERKHVHTHARVGHAVSHKLKRAHVHGDRCEEPIPPTLAALTHCFENA